MSSYRNAHDYRQRIDLLTKQREKIAELLAGLSDMLDLKDNNTTAYIQMIRNLGADDAELAIAIERHKRTLAEIEKADKRYAKEA